MLKCCLCKWSCMFGNDSGFGCMLDRFLDRFWYACLDTFGAIFDTKIIFQPFWLFLDRFGQVLVCIFGHFLCSFWYQFFFSTILIIFWQIWTGFGMHIWTLLVQLLIPKKTFNHFDYLLTDLFMHVWTDLDRFWHACLKTLLWTHLFMHFWWKLWYKKLQLQVNICWQIWLFAS